MMLDNWMTFAAASAILVVMPGPTVLMTLSYALNGGRRIMPAAVLGVLLGDVIAMSVSLMGLGAVLMTSAFLFQILKWAGAVYLIYLGVRMILSAGSLQPALEHVDGPVSPRAAFRDTAMVTTLNPKSILFFIAFVPQFVSPASPILPQLVMLVATFAALGATSVLTYGLLASQLRASLSSSAFPWLGRLGGAVLISMGLATAAYKRTAS